MRKQNLYLSGRLPLFFLLCAELTVGRLACGRASLLAGGRTYRSLKRRSPWPLFLNFVSVLSYRYQILPDFKRDGFKPEIFPTFSLLLFYQKSSAEIYFYLKAAAAANLTALVIQPPRWMVTQHGDSKQFCFSPTNYLKNPNFLNVPWSCIALIRGEAATGEGKKETTEGKATW